jgi:hypothetical protein
LILLRRPTLTAPIPAMESTGDCVACNRLAFARLAGLEWLRDSTMGREPILPFGSVAFRS